MRTLPDIIGTILKEKYRGNRDHSDNGIGDWLKQNVTMKKQGDQWKAHVIQRNTTR